MSRGFLNLKVHAFAFKKAEDHLATLLDNELERAYVAFDAGIKAFVDAAVHSVRIDTGMSAASILPLLIMSHRIQGGSSIKKSRSKRWRKVKGGQELYDKLMLDIEVSKKEDFVEDLRDMGGRLVRDGVRDIDTGLEAGRGYKREGQNFEIVYAGYNNPSFRFGFAINTYQWSVWENKLQPSWRVLPTAKAAFERATAEAQRNWKRGELVQGLSSILTKRYYRETYQ